MDYYTKLFKYRTAGVREYWIVDPDKKRITVYDLEHGDIDDRTAAQAIGYKEFFPYFEGTAPLDACTEKLKQASRNYAKRQLTWFRHMDGVVWLDASAPDVTARAVQLTQEFLAKG